MEEIRLSGRLTLGTEAFTFFSWSSIFGSSIALSHWFYFFFFAFLGPYLRHMEVPRLGVESQLQLPAYTTATAMPDLNCICDPHHSSWQSRVLNPLSEARDRTCIIMEASQIRFCWATMGTPRETFLRDMRLGIEPASSWILVRFLTCWIISGTPHNNF